ncbi:sterol desaturase/sphingolipid hydroxylase (fatty acid hydroxylase superfamily) [Sphingomonas jejuensis]|uniref:Sterol desaturase/sphingolipid hydroxylase (Fatty acid hydroxylase superfamily) n=2 Tax=Sphingomonas jejuensis TaxID=904715 RepID=A0ABX0XLV1_9SPHN|nr:sterol desaturase/sphingolipid hydroxylase (fatty acid hydroxylase superfamily) [Sphingomonas jejuensis]
MTTAKGEGVEGSTTAKTGFWNRSHHLDRMTFRELVIAYFQYPAIMGYLLCAAAAIAAFVWRPASPLQTVAAVAVAALVYPLAWYVLHRWVLHSRWMFKVSPLASTWKRIHYDHHQDPNHLEVLFGALHTTLPAIVVATAPVGWLIGGFGGAMAAIATGLLTTCFYEFCHCIQHLAYKPRNKMLAAMKARHMAHHFHDETGNFGITNYFWDRLFGTFYERQERKAKSPTVFNLGYDEEAAKRWPKVAELSGGVVSGHPRQRHRAADHA